VKHWLSLVNVPEVDQYIEIARFAEEVGYDGISLADHLIMPLDTECRYPYTPDGKMWWPEDTPWPDPWVALTAMAAVTTRLEFATNIYLAALRDPFTAAKAIGTAAVISGERMTCGVSAGWIKEEYELLGLDFKARGRRLDEMIALMKKLWTGQPVDHDGEFFHVHRAIMSPVPDAPIRIWSGGASNAALRRAAENDGWLGVPQIKPQLLETAEGLRERRRKLGRADEPFDVCFSLIGKLDQELMAELDEKGISNNMTLPWMITPWGRTPWLKDDEDPADLEVKKRVMERFARSVEMSPGSPSR
jgi:probable F420-dependent oxidoreductase